VRDPQCEFTDFVAYSPAPAVLRSCSGEHLWVNNAFCAVHGLGRGDVVGRTLHALFPPEVARAHREVDERVLRTGAPERWRLPVVRLDGSGGAVRPGEAAGHTFAVALDGGGRAVGSSWVDQTELAETRQRLAEVDELYAGLFERSCIPIAIYGLDHKLRDANPAYCRLLRYERHAIVGKDIRQLVTPGTTAMYADRWVDVITGRRDGYHMMTSGVRSDGTITTGQTIVSLVRDADGRPAKIYAVSDPTLVWDDDSPSGARVGEAGQLTGRELDVLEGIAEGLSSQELAARFSISAKGVEYHVQKLLKAFDARSRPALVGRAYATGALITGRWPPRAVARVAGSRSDHEQRR
jgi:PAS domain S-box-containing protein